ncbi:hypothetical protein [Roseicella aquatilis]|uniref:Uncharacterized protein n=1 Tax=Roseicella aquatilis TaxID=2527868 RepID=A0A4R4D3E3_9PROT|nr:hypothetical protein [Roseicella aquatilis]TCZ53948.1 hypothetical protein EXY23_23950 [Roseicella aquatilis]
MNATPDTFATCSLRYVRIETHRAAPERGQPAGARLVPLAGDTSGGTVASYSEAHAFLLLCAKITGIAPPVIPLWDETLAKLLEDSRALDRALTDLAHALRPLGAVLTARGNRRPVRSIIEPLELSPQEVTSLGGPDALVGDTALRSVVYEVFLTAIASALVLCRSQQAEDALCAAEEGELYRAGPIAPVLRQRRQRIASTFGELLLLMGVLGWPIGEGAITIGFTDADMADPRAWAKRQTRAWCAEEPSRLAFLNTFLEWLMSSQAATATA